MPFSNNFPYTDLHEININKFLKAIKNLLGGHGGEFLRKKSNIPFDYEWSNVASPSASVTSVNGQTGAVVLDAADVGALPDSYTPPAAPVQSVNGQTGAVVLDAADVGALPDSYTPPAAPVQSVNGQTGAVVLDAEDVGALPASTVITDTKVTQSYIASPGNYAAWRPVLTGRSYNSSESGAFSTVTDDSLTFSALRYQPSTGTLKATKFKGTLEGIANGNYSSSNPPPYPVQSVNGRTGDVLIPQATEGSNYCKMPDGTLIQWGYEQNKSTGATIPFSENYVSSPIVTITPVYNYQSTVRCTMGAGSTATNFIFYAYDTDINDWSTSTTLKFYWMAIGRWK